MKILVVEDDAVQRGVLVGTLKALGAEVIEAQSGEDAVAAVQGADNLDLVLMDLRMPGMGGQEAFYRIRALPGWRGEVPVKAMSAQPQTQGQHAAFDGFLHKGPEIAAALAAAVAEAVPRPAKPASGEQRAFQTTGEQRAFQATDDAIRPQHSALSWMKSNPTLGIFLFGLLTGGGGILLNSTVTLTEMKYHIAENAAAIKAGETRDAETLAAVNREILDLGKRIDSRIGEILNTLNSTIADSNKRADARETEIFTSMNKDISDVAGRIDTQDRRFTELRHIRDAEQSGILQRIAVLEAQFRFFADRMDVASKPPVTPQPAPGKQR